MNGGDCQMRILIGVTVAREVFPRGDHAVLLEAVDQRGAHVGNEVRVLAERAHPDDRVGRVVVDIEYRGKGDVNAERSALYRGDAPLLICEGRVTGRAQTHLWREHRSSAQIDVVREEVASTLTKRDAGLVVGSEDERQTAQALHRVDLLGRLDWRSNRHDEAADVVLANQLLDAGPRGRRRRGVISEDLRPD